MNACGLQMNARKFRQLSLTHLDTPDVANASIWSTLQDKTNAKGYLQQLFKLFFLLEKFFNV